MQPPSPFTYTYLPNSHLIHTVSGPVHTTNHYEPNRDVLLSKQNRIGSNVISNYAYSVNAIGQRTSLATSGTAFPAAPSWAWAYDGFGQLTSADSSNNTQDRSYQYDIIGNTTLATYPSRRRKRPGGTPEPRNRLKIQ